MPVGLAWVVGREGREPRKRQHQPPAVVNPPVGWNDLGANCCSAQFVACGTSEERKTIQNGPEWAKNELKYGSTECRSAHTRGDVVLQGGWQQLPGEGDLWGIIWRMQTTAPQSGPINGQIIGPIRGWIDTHCHLDEFVDHGGDEYANTMRADAAKAGVAHCVIPAVERANWARTREVAHRWGDSYALGIHPLYTPRAAEDDLRALDLELQSAQSDPRLVAVGEIGLDYFVPGLDPVKQEFFYRAQLQLARTFDLPVILHVRRSADKLLKSLRELPVRGGIAHAFNGSVQQAEIFIKMGFKLGFGGALTYERALHLRQLAQQLPLDALVMETDSPDIPPHWLYVTAAEREAGVPQARNSPEQLPRIAEVVAQLRGISVEELMRATSANALVALPRLAAL